MGPPFSGGSERRHRSGAADPFLEFDSETAGGRPAVPHSPSAISPTVGFALGVAGLVAATAAFYQLAQFLSDRQRTAVAVSSPSYTVEALGPAPPAPAAVAAATPLAPRALPAGWVSFESAIDFNVFERGQFRGSTGGGRLKLPAGVHELVLISTAFEIQQSATVTVAKGETARVTMAMPDGSLSINALPWADIWIDDQAVGTTPLANLAVPVGSHEILWKHPTLGERRQTIAVKARTPVHVGVDLRKSPW